MTTYSVDFPYTGHRDAAMLHILIGENNARENWQDCVQRGRSLSWIVPKEAKPGDDVLFVFNKDQFVGTGAIASVPVSSTFNGQAAYRADVRDLKQFKRSLAVEAVAPRIPEWRWPASYTKGRTTPADPIARKLHRIVQDHVARVGLTSDEAPAPSRATEAAPKYWALFADPKTYKIGEAIRDPRPDRWVTAGKPIGRGDLLLIWQGKGRGQHRGVVAFGEVMSDPAQLDDSANPYWVVPPSPDQVEPRVAVRYVVPPRLPLWFDDHPQLLESLSVARARGGTVFKLTREQWDEVFALAGGAAESFAAWGTHATGSRYRRPDESQTVSERNPFEVDPEKIERGNRGHRVTQNALADFLVAHGIEPKSPEPDDPEFDVAWPAAGVTHVAEVKSLTDSNEEKQLRLGLGQVLRYRHLMAQRGGQVTAVLVAEREPRDRTWVSTCADLGVVLVWPAVFEQLR